MQAKPLPLAAFAVASLLPLPLLALGLAFGGAWLWTAFLYMAVLTVLLDQIIPLTAGTPDGSEFPAADISVTGVGVMLDVAVLGAKPAGEVGTCVIESPDLATSIEAIAVVWPTRYGWRKPVGAGAPEITPTAGLAALIAR